MHKNQQIDRIRSGSIKRFMEDDIFPVGSEGNMGSAVIVEQIDEFSPKKMMDTASAMKMMPNLDTKDPIKLFQRKNIITSTANSEDLRTMCAAINPDITHESQEGKMVSENRNLHPRNLINEAYDDFTSKQ